MSIYYILDARGQQIGPIEKQHLANAGLTPETLVWTPGMPQWLPAMQVAELQPLLNVPPPPPATPAMVPPPPPPAVSNDYAGQSNPATAQAQQYNAQSQAQQYNAQSQTQQYHAQSQTQQYNATAQAQQNMSQLMSQPATIYVDYPGNWAIPGWNIVLFVNGIEYAKFPFTGQQSFTLKINEPIVDLKAKLSFRSAKLRFPVEPGRTYRVLLEYNRMWGSIKFKRFE